MRAGTAGGPNDAITAAGLALTVDGVQIAQFSELVELSPDRTLPGSRAAPQKRTALKRTGPNITLGAVGRTTSASRGGITTRWEPPLPAGTRCSSCTTSGRARAGITVRARGRRGS